MPYDNIDDNRLPDPPDFRPMLSYPMPTDEELAALYPLTHAQHGRIEIWEPKVRQSSSPTPGWSMPLETSKQRLNVVILFLEVAQLWDDMKELSRILAVHTISSHDPRPIVGQMLETINKALLPAEHTDEIYNLPSWLADIASHVRIIMETHADEFTDWKISIMARLEEVAQIPRS